MMKCASKKNISHNCVNNFRDYNSENIRQDIILDGSKYFSTLHSNRMHLSEQLKGVFAFNLTNAHITVLNYIE